MSEQKVVESILLSMSTLKNIPLCIHWKLKIYSISSTRFLIEKGLSFKVKVPASILAKSSISSIRLIRLAVDIFQILKKRSLDSLNL